MQKSELTQKYQKQIDIISDFVYSINAAAITLNDEDKKRTAKAGAKLLVLLKPADQKIVIDAIKLVDKSFAGFSGNDVAQVRKVADEITQKAPTWLKRANKDRLKQLK